MLNLRNRLNLGKTAVAKNAGAELVINGSFSNGVNGWVSMQETDGVGSTLDGEGYQAITVTPAETYHFSCKCDRVGVSPSISVKDSTQSGSSLVVFHPSGVGVHVYEGEFTAISSTAVIHFGNGSNTALFDDVSTKQVF